MTYDLYPHMYTEDDTFTALKRIPFDDVIRNMMWEGEEFNKVYWIVIDTVLSASVTPNEHWENMACGWRFDEFRQECIKRSKEFGRPT